MEEPRQDQQKKGNEKVSTFSNHLELVIVQEWIIKQLEKRGNFDYLCFMSLKEHIERELFELDGDEELINNRVECNDELTKVIAGDPDTLKRLFHL